jgi:hypothetical protein
MCDLQLDYICTYKMITEDDEDEKGLSDLMYKIQYLQLFGLTEYDETMINEKLTSVYKKLENEPFLDELFEFHTYKGYMTKEFMFRTMFSYEYFDLFHRLLYNYYHKLPIVDNVRQLKDQLKIYMDERMREMPSNKEE